MKTSQVNAILAALAEIRDLLRGGGYAPMTRTERADYDVAVRTGRRVAALTAGASELDDAKRDALAAVLRALTGSVEGTRENHEALEHRHENRGEECWRRFAPSDIRSMVNDAAREVGIDRFPDPKPGAAPEDDPRR